MLAGIWLCWVSSLIDFTDHFSVLNFAFKHTQGLLCVAGLSGDKPDRLRDGSTRVGGQSGNVSRNVAHLRHHNRLLANGLVHDFFPSVFDGSIMHRIPRQPIPSFRIVAVAARARQRVSQPDRGDLAERSGANGWR